MTKQFDAFIDRQTRVEPRPVVDWATRKAEWLEALEAFYTQVETFLQPYIDQGKLRLDFETITIEEEVIGRYPVRGANILLGAHQLRLEPIGTNVIAARGRVDLIGPGGTVKFVLVDREAEGPRIQVRVWEGETPQPTHAEPESPRVWEWKIATPAPRIRYLPLEAESFYDAIMQVIAG